MKLALNTYCELQVNVGFRANKKGVRDICIHTWNIKLLCYQRALLKKTSVTLINIYLFMFLFIQTQYQISIVKLNWNVNFVCVISLVYDHKVGSYIAIAAFTCQIRIYLYYYNYIGLIIYSDYSWTHHCATNFSK